MEFAISLTLNVRASKDLGATILEQSGDEEPEDARIVAQKCVALFPHLQGDGDQIANILKLAVCQRRKQTDDIYERIFPPFTGREIAKLEQIPHFNAERICQKRQTFKLGRRLTVLDAAQLNVGPTDTVGHLLLR